MTLTLKANGTWLQYNENQGLYKIYHGIFRLKIK